MHIFISTKYSKKVRSLAQCEKKKIIPANNVVLLSNRGNYIDRGQNLALIIVITIYIVGQDGKSYQAVQL